MPILSSNPLVQVNVATINVVLNPDQTPRINKDGTATYILNIVVQSPFVLHWASPRSNGNSHADVITKDNTSNPPIGEVVSSINLGNYPFPSLPGGFIDFYINFYEFSEDSIIPLTLLDVEAYAASNNPESSTTYKKVKPVRYTRPGERHPTFPGSMMKKIVIKIKDLFRTVPLK